MLVIPALRARVSPVSHEEAVHAVELARRIRAAVRRALPERRSVDD